MLGRSDLGAVRPGTPTGSDAEPALRRGSLRKDTMRTDAIRWGNRSVRTLMALAAAATLGGSLLAPLSAPSARAAGTGSAAPDGRTAETAAASCWEIKQNDPDSDDGVYWLVTPTLVAPQQFYCAQEEYGGGWVMIGRGREGWSEDYAGQGAPTQLAETPDGPGAFTPIQLPAKTVDGLLDGGRVDKLADGVRVHRASSIDGTYGQEVRFRIQQRDRWTWALGGANPVRNWVFDGTSGTGGSTRTFGEGDGWHVSSFVHRATHKKKAGWAYGRTVTGTGDSSSYLWAPAGEGYAIPFAQVFVRPKLRLSDLSFPTAPATGTPAAAVRALPRSTAMKTQWGVAQSAEDEDGSAAVRAFGQAGASVFVGGDFRYVQRTESGIGRAEQPYLAAFDVTTGEWLPRFRPDLDGEVTAMTTLPDGRLAIGGRFTTVDGAPQPGLALLDPSTGRLAGPQVTVEQRETARTPAVLGLDVHGDELYLAGSFTHLSAADADTATPAHNGGRIDLATGLPDPEWNPDLNGTALAIDASDLGDRAYVAGYFTATRTTPSRSAAALTTAPGAAPVPPLWAPAFSATGVPARAVVETGGRVYLGSTRRSIAAYDHATFRVLTGSTASGGSDIRSILAAGTVVIGGCACGRYTYQYQGETLKRKTRKMRARALQVDRLDGLGAWDGATGVFLPDWAPRLGFAGHLGVQRSFVDSAGALWVGGDLDRSVRAGGSTQWSGGFARFAPGDSTPPTTPGPITSTPVAGGEQAVLTWGASTDTTDVVYEVLRGDRVVATTTASTYTVPITADPTAYQVRARDTAGNRSAGTAAFVVQPPSPADLTFIGDRDTWAWRYSATAPPSDWTTPGFDDSSWHTGSGLFGAGVRGAATTLSRGGGRPLSAQFRKSFEVQNAATVTNARVSVIADDGAVLTLNGTELGRIRMPDGQVTADTLATQAVSPPEAAGGRVVIPIPADALIEGTNVLAVSVHTADRARPALGFDLALIGERAAPPQPVTGLSATSTADTIALTWRAPAGGTAPASYVIRRDGKQVGIVAAPTVAFSDGDLAASAGHRYTVVAVAADGQASTAATLQASTTADAPIAIANGSAWSWRYTNAALPAGWNTLGFDASGWATGAALLGRGARVATDIDPGHQSPSPISAQFRHEFTVTHPATVRDGTVTVIADDGVVVYLNGVELGRARMPGGAIGQNTFASASAAARGASARRVSFVVPARLLVKGTNVLAASVHANYRTTPDLSFDLAMTMARG